MPSCSIPSCTNNNTNCRGKTVRFHRFPLKSPEILDEWKKVCGGKELNLNNARICSIHFKKSCYIPKPEHLIIPDDDDIYVLSKTAIPTENLSNIKCSSRVRKRAYSDSNNSLQHQVNPKKMESQNKENRSFVRNMDDFLNNEDLRARSTSVNILRSSNAMDISDLSSLSVASFNTETSTVNTTCLHSSNSTNANKDVQCSQSLDNTKQFRPDIPTSLELDHQSPPSISFINLNKNDIRFEETNHPNNQERVLQKINHAYEDVSVLDLENAKLKLRKEVELLKKEVARLSSLQLENNQLKQEKEEIRVENEILKEKVTKLTKKERLKEKKAEKDIERKVQQILEPIFTKGQIKKLIHPKKTRIKWHSDDIASAIALKSVSPAGYRYLRKKNFPLPGLSTMRKRAAKIKMNSGILSEVLSVMETKGKHEPLRNKICILSFDEIHISQRIEIERREEKRVGPHKSVQLGMVRGLFKNWKQPIYYDYDQPLTKEIALDTIGKLHDAGCVVVVVISDLAKSDTSVWNSLGIGHDKKRFFSHPKDPNLKVFVFADSPHLLKLIRNNFIDSGFNYNGKTLNKDCLEEVLKLNNKDSRIPHKLDRKHIDVIGTERQRVSLAAQLFSHTTAQAIEWFGRNDFLSCDNWSECSDFFELVDKWFGVFNSKRKFDKSPHSSAYGVYLQEQNQTLNDMSRLIESIRVGSHKELLPFQMGILLNNQSLPELLSYLQENYSTEDFDIQYVLTNRLNQDCIENFFSYIRRMGAGHDKPCALQLRYRLKWYVLGRHCSDMFIETANTEDDNGFDLTDVDDYNSVSNDSDAVEREAMLDVLELSDDI